MGREGEDSCRGGADVHHHSLGVVDGDVVVLCSCLQFVKGGLLWCMLLCSLGLGVDGNAHGAVTYILPSTWGVGESIIY